MQERTRMLATFDDLRATGERVTRLRTPIVTRTGEERTIAWNIDFLPGERALQRNETIHRLLLENLQEGIWWIDPEGRSLYANARLAELLGVRAAELRRADGSLGFVHVSGGPLDASRDGVYGALLTVIDLSVQRRLNEEHALLVQAVGTLAGGVRADAVSAIDPDANGHIAITVHEEATPGPSLVLTVSDDGIGMDDETLARVFEPFFSTRPVGQGTGMGLAVVHGITSGSGGAIRATSAIGEGTTFVVTLPAVLVEEDGELIMVVDDESALVDLLGKTLAAYDRFAADPTLYSVVLTDITMPELRGDQLADRIRSIRPETPVVGYTGYSETVDGPRAAAAGIRRLLRKPLDTDEFVGALRTALQEEKDE